MILEGKKVQEPFVVLVSKVTFLGDTMKQYHLVTRPSARHMTELTGHQAREIIRENGLIKVLETPEGRVYDTPGRDFYAKFEGYYAKQFERLRCKSRDALMKYEEIEGLI